MATIRVRDWTKERIEEIREAESHSSHDSVIKSLLKDRELAQFAGEPTAEHPEDPEERLTEPADKAFDDLTVLSELETADSGVLFLWCPNCGTEMAHVGVENPLSISVYEAECQRCLTRLDQHAIVAIEIGYPIERQIVDGTLQGDLRTCVLDYWDRTLELLEEPTLSSDLDEEQFVRRIDRYYREFDWDWPADVPVVALEVGRTYRNDATGERFEVLGSESRDRKSLVEYRVHRLDDDGDVTGEPDVLEPQRVIDLVLDRRLFLEDVP